MYFHNSAYNLAKNPTSKTDVVGLGYGCPEKQRSVLFGPATPNLRLSQATYDTKNRLDD